jgi:predicted HTH domain antitoxin
MVKLFEIGKISSGTAARVLEISRVEFLDLLAKYNVSVFGQSDINDISEDIANA